MSQLPPAFAEARLQARIQSLLELPAEASWAEFKHNNQEPAVIGKLISALSNAARLADQDFAYVLWGVRDGDRSVVGTEFEPSSQQAQREPLEFWLNKRLRPAPLFTFQAVDFDGVRLVLLEIPAAANSPVEYDGRAYVRIGSATPPLADHPQHQRTLWAKLQPYAWETGIAAQFQTSDQVLGLLDYSLYFSMTGQPLPDNRDGILSKLAGDRLIRADVGGRWDILNLGAILFATRLSDFSPSLARKGVRFVAYGGSGRTDDVTHRQEGQRGYAAGFRGLMDYISALLPQNEIIGLALREARPLFPLIALRELIANALIHQDMTITGAGPLIELFKDRIEITNPGRPLVGTDRFLDSPPRSRNEALAALMRRMGLCEEQGTGIDKVLGAVEVYQLPPPEFSDLNESVRVSLFAPRGFAKMSQDERVRACYQHAV